MHRHRDRGRRYRHRHGHRAGNAQNVTVAAGMVVPVNVMDTYQSTPGFAPDVPQTPNGYLRVTGWPEWSPPCVCRSTPRFFGVQAVAITG
jgi:hypothetical protein